MFLEGASSGCGISRPLWQHNTGVSAAAELTVYDRQILSGKTELVHSSKTLGDAMSILPLNIAGKLTVHMSPDYRFHCQTERGKLNWCMRFRFLPILVEKLDYCIGYTMVSP